MDLFVKIPIFFCFFLRYKIREMHTRAARKIKFLHKSTINDVMVFPISTITLKISNKDEYRIHKFVRLIMASKNRTHTHTKQHQPRSLHIQELFFLYSVDLVKYLCACDATIFNYFA